MTAWKPGNKRDDFLTKWTCGRRSILLIAVQPRFSTVRCKVLSSSPLPCYPSPSSMVVRSRSKDSQLSSLSATPDSAVLRTPPPPPFCEEYHSKGLNPRRFLACQARNTAHGSRWRPERSRGRHRRTQLRHSVSRKTELPLSSASERRFLQLACGGSPELCAVGCRLATVSLPFPFTVHGARMTGHETPTAPRDGVRAAHCPLPRFSVGGRNPGPRCPARFGCTPNGGPSRPGFLSGEKNCFLTYCTSNDQTQLKINPSRWFCPMLLPANFLSLLIGRSTTPYSPAPSAAPVCSVYCPAPTFVACAGIRCSTNDEYKFQSACEF